MSNLRDGSASEVGAGTGTAAPLVEVQHLADGAVQRLVLRRPPLNILSTAMLAELDAALAAAAEEPALKALVVGAAPGARAFSAGVDVADHTAERVAEMLGTFHRVCWRLRTLPVPTVAVVDGAALGGGCELAASCDLVLASPRARFGQPEIKLAAFAPVASLLLPTTLGAQQAADWLLTGRTVGAEEAARAGLVSRLAPEDGLAETEASLLAELAASSAVALRLAKQALSAGRRDEELQRRLAHLEGVYLGELMATADAHEGLAAFLERRPPQWRNR